MPSGPSSARSAGGASIYGDLLDRSARYARVLRSLGVARGDRVAVQVDKSPEALFLYFATLRAGAVFLPLNTAYTTAEVEYLIADAAPRLLTCRPGDLDRLRHVATVNAAACETLDPHGGGSLLEVTAAQVGEPLEDAVVGEEDLAALLYTSGTIRAEPTIIHAAIVAGISDIMFWAVAGSRRLSRAASTPDRGVPTLKSVTTTS